MKGFVGEIEELAEENTIFCRVLYTRTKLQLAGTSIAPGGEIGEELHHGGRKDDDFGPTEVHYDAATATIRAINLDRWNASNLRHCGDEANAQIKQASRDIDPDA